MAGQAPFPTAGATPWVLGHRRWAQEWRQVAMVALPLAYLVYVFISVSENSRGGGQVAGYAIVAAFAACWLAAPVVISDDTPGLKFWGYFAILLALSVAGLPFARAAGFVTFVYLTMLVVGRLGVRSAPVVIAFSLAALLVPISIPSWHVSLEIGRAHV